MSSTTSTTAGKDCDFFTTHNINWTANWLAKCPFDESMCVGPAMQLDTGRINSNIILGINSPLQDQVDFRKITTCAPITQENCTMKLTNSTILAEFDYYDPDDEYVAYTYGSFETSGTSNVTTISSAHIANITSARTLWSESYSKDSGFSPIAELSIPNGDGVLLFIRNNGLIYLEPCDDPVFGAHRIKQTKTNMTVYTSDHLAGIIGCSEQAIPNLYFARRFFLPFSRRLL
ncbi:hypothetical protein F4818DRAFT_311894 [Hypoxylon cercidicola]|nr:hypothetical protein F4818DRAFT_311894 [Hypoxylon cercidicola]